MNSDSSSPCVVILTALSVERQAVAAHLLNLHEGTHPEGTVYWHGSFPSERCEWQAKLVEIGSGNADAAFETERAISYFKPEVTLFVGVAGGLKDVHIGDVVVANKVYNYESGKASIVFQPRPQVGNATYRMEQRARADAGNRNWLKRIKGPAPLHEPTVYVAPIVAGEKVINSTRSDIYLSVRDQYSDALAVEMEGHGFLRAVRANQFVNALVIRGISDLVEGKSKEDANGSQVLASRHASAFAFEILARLGADKHFLTKVAQTRPAKAQKHKRLAPKYSISNTGQMAVGDNASMTNNNWYQSQE